MQLTDDKQTNDAKKILYKRYIKGHPCRQISLIVERVKAWIERRMYQ